MLRSLGLLVSLISILSCSFVQRPEIMGTWYFDRFGGPHGETSDDPNIANANKQHQGLSFTFTRDNKLITRQPGQMAVHDTTVDYKVLADRREVVIGGDTMRIMLLTSQILELYPNNQHQAALYLKRSKDGKTAMSAP
jgi:hypothetical protein